MCGIAGVLNFDREEPVSEDLMRRMVASLRHRGPDDTGVHVDGNAGLGFARLSIMDLSPAAGQPMPNEDETIWSVVNGEIYNFQDLRHELEGLGHSFRSRSDSEVVVHLYEEYGSSLFARLRGMFALGIWDSRKRRLLLARDRLGKKPLVYHVDQGALAFASEVKAILQDSRIRRQVNPDGVDRFLSFGYVPDGTSAFHGVRKLLPGEFLSCADGKIERETYWKASFSKKLTMSERECSERLLALLKEAIRLRLVSDVPLGVFLSGGVDSSLVVALMSELADEVKSISIGFDDAKYDELLHARIVADRYSSEHIELVLKPSALEVLPNLVWHYGEPFADSSAIPSYYVSRLAKEHVTVALNGDGGDEAFAGYGRYVSRRVRNALHGLPLRARSSIANAIRAVGRGMGHGRIELLGTVLTQPLVRRYADFMTLEFFEDAERRSLYTPEFLEQVSCQANGYVSPIMAESDARDWIDKVLYTEMRTVLPGDLLVKMDIASMANGLEARSPFLDHEFVEFTTQIPSSLKLRRGIRKYILKKAARRYLPKSILYRRKQGFAIPLETWFRGPLGEFASEVLTDRATVERGFFVPGRVEQLLASHMSGQENHDHRLWSLLNLELWCRQYIDTPEMTTSCPMGEANLGRT